jgi:hypothetical protein
MGQWSGVDWQSYCDELLIARFGANYQRIPDTLGDYGAEGFTADGMLVQAYAAEEVIDSKKLYEAQRDKVTRDIRTIQKNRRKLRAMMSVPITRVAFLVPECRTKDLIAHCGRKAQEVRKQAFAEFRTDFDLRVLTADDFPEERRRLGKNAGLRMSFEEVIVDGDEMTSWADSNSALALNLQRKLESVDSLSPDQRTELGVALIRMYLQREHVLRQLHEYYPAMYEELVRSLRSREHALAVENLVDRSTALMRVRDLAEELESRIHELAPNIRSHLNLIGWGTVAEWLLRCPLKLEVGT